MTMCHLLGIQDDESNEIIYSQITEHNTKSLLMRDNDIRSLKANRLLIVKQSPLTGFGLSLCPFSTMEYIRDLLHYPFPQGPNQHYLSPPHIF